MTETAFKAGKDAQVKGVLRAEAPYRPGSARYADWVQGWDAALRARHGDQSRLAEKADLVERKDDSLVSGTPDLEILGDRPTEK